MACRDQRETWQEIPSNIWQQFDAYGWGFAVLVLAAYLERVGAVELNIFSSSSAGPHPAWCSVFDCHYQQQ